MRFLFLTEPLGFAAVNHLSFSEKLKSCLVIRTYNHRVKALQFLQNTRGFGGLVFCIDCKEGFDDFSFAKLNSFASSGYRQINKTKIHIKQEFLKTGFKTNAFSTSAHNVKELITAKKAGCNSVFISPVFNTFSDERHKKGLGLLKFYRFASFAKKLNLNPIALGGLNARKFANLAKINKLYNLQSFARSFTHI